MTVSDKIVEGYLADIKKIKDSNTATELTYRPRFKEFIEALYPGYTLIHEQQKIENVGRPDFTVEKDSLTIGYIETKDVGKRLEDELTSDQMKRYMKWIDNLLLTDYNRFILIRNGELVKDEALTHSFSGHFQVNQGALELLKDFFSTVPKKITSPYELAERLALKARNLKAIALEQLNSDLVMGNKTPLVGFYETVKAMVPDMKPAACADAYAQTITYGLMYAGWSHKKTAMAEHLTINTAFDSIKEKSIIKRIMRNLEMTDDIRWVAEEICRTIDATDFNSVFNQGVGGWKGASGDSLIYFYENFLSEYDDTLKKSRGVYYTPREVVSFIMNQVNEILKREFGKKLGIADETVTLLDPATGTSTFLRIAFALVARELRNQGLRSTLPRKIDEHLLKHFAGFELLLAPYILAHLRLSSVLTDELGYQNPSLRIPVYLTNSLWAPHPKIDTGTLDYFYQEISDEQKEADRIKEGSTLVIVGNPPYSVSSQNMDTQILDWLSFKKEYQTVSGPVQDYFTVDGHPLNERNTKLLHDDYVKFIRFAQRKIDLSGEGVLGFITNNGYMDNETFKGMRQSLLQSFNIIYLINLHGNTLKHEKQPNGKPDQNVFDIMVGTGIILAIKRKNDTTHKVRYVELFSNRETKLDWLEKNERVNLDSQTTQLSPSSQFYYFVPITNNPEYESLPSIDEIFITRGLGIVTARDSITIHNTEAELKEVVSFFLTHLVEEIKVKYNACDDEDWKVEWAKKDLLDSLKSESCKTILYRPFDIRFTWYTGRTNGFMKRPRYNIMKDVIDRDNLLLAMSPKSFPDTWQDIMVTDKITNFHLTGGGTHVFLLYHDDKPNFNASLLKSLSSEYGEFQPEDLFYYIYAVLYSNRYRTRYGEVLKRGFPRIPFVANKNTFVEFAKLGKQLIDAHLMHSFLPTMVTFPMSGDNIVKAPHHDGDKLFINKTQYFENVPKAVWEYKIGSYQVLNKYLKSRRGRVLSPEEIEHVGQIVAIIEKTSEIVKEIDRLDFLPALKITLDGNTAAS
jgi:type I restriction-modification system DNA methylase subunit